MTLAGHIPVGGYTGDDEQTWRIMKLYALSRVNDYLIELRCPARVEFFSGIGLTSFEHAEAFSPFHHEIVADAEGLHLNWDGTVDIGDDPPMPTADDDPLDERRELLLHRCFVRGPLPRDEADRYPYDDRLSLAAAEWPLRPESIVRVAWAR